MYTCYASASARSTPCCLLRYCCAELLRTAERSTEWSHIPYTASHSFWTSPWATSTPKLSPPRATAASIFRCRDHQPQLLLPLNHHRRTYSSGSSCPSMASQHRAHSTSPPPSFRPPPNRLLRLPPHRREPLPHQEAGMYQHSRRLLSAFSILLTSLPSSPTAKMDAACRACRKIFSDVMKVYADHATARFLVLQCFCHSTPFCLVYFVHK
jgi:hypothetical protein